MPSDQLYHITRTITDPNPALSSYAYTVDVLGTYTDLLIAKKAATAALFPEGYLASDFETYAENDRTSAWKFGNGVKVYAKAFAGQTLEVRVDTKPNTEGWWTSKGKVEGGLFYVFETITNFFGDGLEGPKTTEVEGAVFSKIGALAAAKTTLLGGVTRDSYAEYDEKDDARDVDEWPYEDDVVVHAVSGTGENFAISVKAAKGHGIGSTAIKPFLNMDEELQDLRRQLAESKAKIVEEQRLRVEGEVRRAEGQRRREAAEADAKQSQPKNLVDYLGACHNFSLSLQVVTDETLVAKGDTTKPAGRLYPQRIVPWKNFPQQQETFWEELSISPLFTSQQVYPSSHQLAYVQNYLDPISSELGLWHHARETVENPVRTVVAEIYKDEELRERLQLCGTLMFESYTNLGKSSNSQIEEEVEHRSIPGPPPSKAEMQKKGKGIARGNNRGITGSADQFCIYELADGQRVPAVLIEYKAPHKLPVLATREILPFDQLIRPP